MNEHADGMLIAQSHPLHTTPRFAPAANAFGKPVGHVACPSRYTHTRNDSDDAPHTSVPQPGRHMTAGVVTTPPSCVVALHEGPASDNPTAALNIVALASSTTHALVAVIDCSSSSQSPAPVASVPTHDHLPAVLHPQHPVAVPVTSGGARSVKPAGHCGFALVGNAATGDHPSGIPASKHDET